MQDHNVSIGNIISRLAKGTIGPGCKPTEDQARPVFAMDFAWMRFLLEQ
jgi:hypothetical protein